MLISNSMQKVIRVLLVKKQLSLRELSTQSNVSLGLTVKLTNDLAAIGYIEKKVKIKVKDWGRLLKAWAYSVSVNENKKIEFIAPERPQYIIKKISEIANKNKLRYGFTLYSATELISPYISPSEVHLYVTEKDKWEKILPKNNIFPAEKGNIILYLVDELYLYGSEKIRDSYVVSFPQLYVDLFSLKGRAEEAAEQLLKVLRNQRFLAPQKSKIFKVMKHV